MRGFMLSADRPSGRIPSSSPRELTAAPAGMAPTFAPNATVHAVAIRVKRMAGWSLAEPRALALFAALAGRIRRASARGEGARARQQQGLKRFEA
eukprot:6213569-Pleurochrysis_carterae.AAC.1